MATQIPIWLDDILAANSNVDLATEDGRSQLGAAILHAIPRELVVTAIRESAKTTLIRRAIADAAGDLSHELARNAAASVLINLEVEA